MSCKKWEEPIYLYEELTEEERQQLNIHLQQCAECNVLFKSVQQMQMVVKGLSGNKALVRDSELLTNKIMRSLSSENPSGARKTDVFSSLMDSLFTRYALGAVSLALIFFFVNEQQGTIDHPKREIIYSESKASVPLNTNAFMMEIIKDNPAENSLYACIKSNECEYEIVKIYKQKKNHENL